MVTFFLLVARDWPRAGFAIDTHALCSKANSQCCRWPCKGKNGRAHRPSVRPTARPQFHICHPLVPGEAKSDCSPCWCWTARFVGDYLNRFDRFANPGSAQAYILANQLTARERLYAGYQACSGTAVA